MRCPQYARFKPQKRTSGAPRGNAGHAKGAGTLTIKPDFVPITLATFRVMPNGSCPSLGMGLKGVPKALRAGIKARRAALTMTLPRDAQKGEVRVLADGNVKRDGYKSRDDRHRHYAWKGIKP